MICPFSVVAIGASIHEEISNLIKANQINFYGILTSNLTTRNQETEK